MSEHVQNMPLLKQRDIEIPIDCKVRTSDFEGPLDLLLHLIKTHELDILDLPVSKITKQYLNYLNYMREINIDLASEYLVMAATLTYIKSQFILPAEKEDEATGPDPRSQLIRQLMQLKNYKELSEKLTNRPRLFREIFLCRNAGYEEIEDSIEPQVSLSNPYQLVKAYEDFIHRKQKIVHEVTVDTVPIAVSIEKIVAAFKKQESIYLRQLLPQPYNLQQFISMFLAALEMSKIQMTKLSQEKVFGPIQISKNAEDAELEKVTSQFAKQLSWD